MGFFLAIVFLHTLAKQEDDMLASVQSFVNRESQAFDSLLLVLAPQVTEEQVVTFAAAALDFELAHPTTAHGISTSIPSSWSPTLGLPASFSILSLFWTVSPRPPFLLCNLGPAKTLSKIKHAL